MNTDWSSIVALGFAPGLILGIIVGRLQQRAKLRLYQTFIEERLRLEDVLSASDSLLEESPGQAAPDVRDPCMQYGAFSARQ